MSQSERNFDYVLIMNPQVIAARWALGRIYSEQLPQIALQWLEDGFDSPTLRILAGETNPIMSEVGPIFERVLEELNIAVPTSAEYVLHLVREVAQNIVEAKITPYDGASRLYDLHSAYADNSDSNFSGAIGYLSIEYEDFSELYTRNYHGEEHCQRVRDELDAKIIAEARQLIIQCAVE